MSDDGVTWVAVCPRCWRRAFGRRRDLHVGGWPGERCVLCAEETGHGVYINYVATLQDIAAQDPTLAAQDGPGTPGPT